jgi:hypothetical protein
VQENDQRDIGRLEAKVEHLEKTVTAMDEKLDVLTGYMSEARGSWRTLLAIGGLASACGAAVAWLIGFLFHK